RRHGGALADELANQRPPDSTARADDHSDRAVEGLLCWQPFELSVLEQPVLNVERLLAVERRVVAHALRAAHDADPGAVARGRPSGFGLRLAPRDEADAGNQDDARGRPAHRRRVCPLRLRVALGRTTAVLPPAG